MLGKDRAGRSPRGGFRLSISGWETWPPRAAWIGLPGRHSP